MAKVAFLGLGVMGFPMAGHLATKGGHEVTVYNRTAAKSKAWAEKFGGRAAVEGIFARVRQAGSASGVTFAFENISLRVNTLQAHRLVHWAQRRGDAEALVERLFVGSFQRGENLGDTAVLTRIAEECSYPVAEVVAYLASDTDRQTVLDREREVHAMGINMVPTYIIDGREVVVGAEDPSILANAMRKALAA